MFEQSDREGGENLQQFEQNKKNERKKSRGNEESVNEKHGETLKRKTADYGQVITKNRGLGLKPLFT